MGTKILGVWILYLYFTHDQEDKEQDNSNNAVELLLYNKGTFLSPPQ